MNVNEIFHDSLLGSCEVILEVGIREGDILYLVRRQEDGVDWLLSKCTCCGGTIKRTRCDDKVVKDV